MASLKETKQSYSALSWPRDGFCFVSKPFIERTLSPRFWLLERRQPDVLKHLARLQYQVLAYRCLNGTWPKVSDLKRTSDGLTYKISADGIISSEDWGSIYDPKPLSEILPPKFSERDISDYEDFKESSKHIGPCGFAVGLLESLWIETDYTPQNDRLLTKFGQLVGTERIAADELAKYPSFAAVQLHCVIDFHYVLCTVFGVYEGDPKSKDEVNKQLQNFVASKDFDFFATFKNRISVSLEATDTPDAGLLSQLQEAIQGGYGIVVLSFHIQSLDRCKPILDRLTQMIETSTVQSHSGIEYTLLSFRWFKIYLIPTPKNLHLAFNEPSCFRVCETLAAGTGTREISSIGGQSMVIEVDPKRQVQALYNAMSAHTFDDATLQAMREAYDIGSKEEFLIQSQLGYLVDMQVLQEALGPEADVKKYFRYPPEHIRNVPSQFRDGKVLLNQQPLESIWDDPAIRTEQSKKLIAEFEQKTLGRIEKLRAFNFGLELKEDHFYSRLDAELPFQAKKGKPNAEGFSWPGGFCLYLHYLPGCFCGSPAVPHKAI